MLIFQAPTNQPRQHCAGHAAGAGQRPGQLPATGLRGQLLFFFEMTTAYTGELLDIDAFNQPGVEESKIASYAVLGNQNEKYLKKAEEMKGRPAGKKEYIL